jgi:hypothetical protein
MVLAEDGTFRYLFRSTRAYFWNSLFDLKGSPVTARPRPPDGTVRRYGTLNAKSRESSLITTSNSAELMKAGVWKLRLLGRREVKDV